jgi:hypothetical protein
MFLKDKFSSPVIKLLRSDNLEFILSFFYFIFRNIDKQIDTIRQIKLEKELVWFIKNYNQEIENSYWLIEEKNEENAWKYIEIWIKLKFLRRLEINEFWDDYDIELSEASLQVMNFVDNLGIEEDLLYASVKSNFENALANLKDIAFSSKSFKKQNIAEIDKQIKNLEIKKKLIKIWDLSVFEEEVYDKYNSAKDLLKRLPIDFRKVENVFENIYRDIQKKSNDIELNRWEILSFTLDEIEEKINNSPQWKSFEWFENFYRIKPKELFDALEKVFEKYEKISRLEGQKSIKSIINVDLLKAKKRAYNKKTFLVSKLREIFNEENLKERKIWVNLIKEIKKISLDNSKNFEYRNNFYEINSWVNIDLFMWKKLWEPKMWIKLVKYDEKISEKEEIDIENIFRYTTISETEVKNNIANLLRKKDEAYLDEVLNKFPIKYWIDEFMSYLKVAIYDNHDIYKDTLNNFEIKWIHNNLKIESSEIKFKK